MELPSLESEFEFM